MKKFILSVFIILTLTVISVSADNSALTIDDLGGQVGDVIAVEVKATASEAVAGQLEVVYDSNILDGLDIEKGSALGATTVFSNKVGNKYKFSWIGRTQMSDGVFCTIYFRILSADLKQTQLTIENVMLSDADAKPVTVDVKNATVYINSFVSKSTLKQNGAEITEGFSDGTVSVEYTLMNYTKKAVNSDIWIGTFSNGKLVSVKNQNHNVVTGGVKASHCDINVDSSITEIKVLTWSADGNIIPLAVPKIIER